MIHIHLFEGSSTDQSKNRNLVRFPWLMYNTISPNVKLTASQVWEQALLDLPDILNCCQFSQATFYHVVKLWRKAGNIISAVDNQTLHHQTGQESGGNRTNSLYDLLLPISTLTNGLCTRRQFIVHDQLQHCAISSPILPCNTGAIMFIAWIDCSQGKQIYKNVVTWEQKS
jgi:hypothetical protein